jgi:hypothetical protein
MVGSPSREVRSLWRARDVGSCPHSALDFFICGVLVDWWLHDALPVDAATTAPSNSLPKFPSGKIVELFPRADGVVRNVLLDVNGRRKERAVRLLSQLQSGDAKLADVETFGSERLNLDATSDPEIDASPVLHHHQPDAVDPLMLETPDAHDGLDQPPLLDSMQLLVLLSDAL